jgi:beta-lactamase regulating signal transducer with metallopeptidase domain
MILDLAYAALNIAIQHVALSLVAFLAALWLCRLDSISSAWRATILLVALMLPVAAPLLPDSPLSSNLRAIASNTELQPTAQADHAYDMRNEPPSPAASASTPGIAGDALRAEAGMIALPPVLALLLAGIWLAGTCWRLLRLVIGECRLHGIVAASTTAEDLLQAHPGLVPASVAVRLTNDFGPAATGILRPRVLIPRALAATLPAPALRSILLHESAHIQRGDILSQRLQRIAEAVFWWNPLVAATASRLDIAREIACDLSAARMNGSNTGYAESLLDVFEHIARLGIARSTPALGMAMSHRQLDARISSLMQDTRRMGIAPRLAVIFALFIVIGSGMLARAGSPQVGPAPATAKAMDVDPQEEARNASLRNLEAAGAENQRQREERRIEDARQREENRIENARQREERTTQNLRQLEEHFAEVARQREEASAQAARQQREWQLKMARNAARADLQRAR